MTEEGERIRKSESQARRHRNFPRHKLEEVLVLPQKIQDEMGGKAMKRLLLADALGISPSSSNYRNLLSSSLKYGLTEGTEKASEISLTPVGEEVTQLVDQHKRLRALRTAAMTPEIFRAFYTTYAEKKLPSAEMMAKILTSEFEVPTNLATECSELIIANGRFVHIVRDISGSSHVLLDAAPPDTVVAVPTPSIPEGKEAEESASAPMRGPKEIESAKLAPKPIFIGHGKKKGPLHQLQKILTSFQIPHKVVGEEANLGRPIPQKVKETMQECGSAILIFTCDEKLFDEQSNEIWRPGENVVHELGAASYAYEDRVVIFKEKGLHFPSNFQSIGYIEFEEGGLEARTTELLKELVGFGLVKITTG
jgi:hypothetical protein